MMQAKYAAMFQAGWFIESMWSQTLVIHMTRTPKLPFKKGLSQKYGAAPNEKSPALEKPGITIGNP